MSEVLIRCENVGKKFCRNLKKSLWYGLKDSASSLMGRPIGNNGDLRSGEFWANHDISFELRRGERYGLVGGNGAGKTTLLKLISGLIQPDLGTITVQGRVGSLIALGAGFNPVLTGRENIFVNGSVLGLTKRSVDRKLQQIVRFAELEDAIDSPLATYSSGMQARLGFAVATHLEPDILLVDEVLAVGDFRFRLKCYDVINKLISNGTSLMIVSHSITTLLAVCEKGLWLQQGKVAAQSHISAVLSNYTDDGISSSAAREASFSGIVNNLTIQGSSLVKNGRPKVGEPASISIHFTADREYKDCRVIVMLQPKNAETLPIMLDSGPERFRLCHRTRYIEFTTSHFSVPPGDYFVKASILTEPFNLLGACDGVMISVRPSSISYSRETYLPGDWAIL